ncbi:hypothetical protein, partial [Salmonella enterica]|uniref:hypothetical protein n=1 Tax=Salmonella enterica TaxID=28901 RepID=UPI003CF4E629
GRSFRGRRTGGGRSRRRRHRTSESLGSLRTGQSVDVHVGDRNRRHRNGKSEENSNVAGKGAHSSDQIDDE